MCLFRWHSKPMDAVGLWAVLGVLIAGTAAGVARRRNEGQFRDVRPPVDAGTNARSSTAADSNARPADEHVRPFASTASRATETDEISGGLTSGAPIAVATGTTAADAALTHRAEEIAATGAVRAVVPESPLGGAGRGGELPTPDVREEPGAIEVGDPSAAGAMINAELLAELGVEPGQATLLQFSSAFCAPCRSVRRVSAEVAGMVTGVRHVEVDAESHLDAVRALGIWRTPTLLIVDGEGRIAKRATGGPTKPHLIAALAEVL
jgi:thiol-disulfide isomerase/thioredoxin